MSNRISPEVSAILGRCSYNGQRLFLPQNLDRKDYVAVNKVIESLGGKWTRKVQSHVFEGDARKIVTAALSEGKYVDPKKDECFFETPPELAAEMVGYANIRDEHLVLEPSAGFGRICIAIMANSKAEIHVCESSADRRSKLSGVTIVGEDFLQYEPGSIYDRIVANPPFSKGVGIDHLQHMIEVLKPGGRLVCVMPSSLSHSATKKVAALRDEILQNGEINPLPEKTFQSSGTNVNTCLVIYDKPE